VYSVLTRLVSIVFTSLCSAMPTRLIVCVTADRKLKQVNIEEMKFGKWNITLRITGCLDFVCRPEFYITTKLNVPETGSVSVWEVERGRCVGLTTLSPFVSRLFRQCGILIMSQPYRPPRPVTGVALLFTFFRLQAS
jgi:hypothetical protein